MVNVRFFITGMFLTVSGEKNKTYYLHVCECRQDPSKQMLQHIFCAHQQGPLQN